MSIRSSNPKIARYQEELSALRKEIRRLGPGSVATIALRGKAERLTNWLADAGQEYGAGIDAKATDRAQLHRALDAVMDQVEAKDVLPSMEEAKRLGAPVQKAYEAYRGMDTDALKKIYGRFHRVSDLRGLSKGSLITDILRDEFGDRKVDAWAQAY